ncbi:hypothetical protein BP422_08690 [Brevibacillus formosus]|uniref:Uncharacterized protein n=1 Tax=Brevibacillus formosus TaxID=54913 RepID=A0A220MF42_9BACL|nr:hypothetical protein BP422_08690 [Brevibacillus formosus]
MKASTRSLAQSSLQTILLCVRAPLIADHESKTGDMYYVGLFFYAMNGNCEANLTYAVIMNTFVIGHLNKPK